MIKCKSCGHQIKTSNQTCSLCGAKTQYKLWRLAKVLWIFVGSFIGILALVLALALSFDNPPEDTSITLPKHIINQRKVSESRVKTQVTMEVIVPDCADRGQLRALMEHLYNKAAKSTGYKLRTHPNAVYIRLWRSTSDFGRVMPLARVDKHASYDNPAYIFNDDRLAAFNLPPDYLGFTEAQRREIWDGYKAILTKYLAKAKKAHPETKNAYEWLDNDRVKSLKAQLLVNHNLSQDEFNKIFVEGQGKGWPEEIMP